MKTKQAYIVIDTNVLISAGLLPRSKTAQVLALAVEHFVIAQNEHTWHELETRIARPKFDRYFGDSGRLKHLVKIAQSIQRFEISAEVTISRDYHLGMHEVTQAQYKKIMGKNPSDFQGDAVAERHPETNRVVKEVDSANHPVDQVSWRDAVEFCQRLSALPEEKKAGRIYRLPTEAEWEYACRAGSQMAYSFGSDEKSLVNFGWYKSNSNSMTHAVGLKKANAWGLYDMHGNVWEWCADCYGEYPKGSATDPRGPEAGSDRVARGGSWFGDAVRCRSALRNGFDPSFRFNFLGFRVALSSSGIPK